MPELNPEVSRRVAYAASRAELSARDRFDLGPACEGAVTFTDLPQWVRDMVEQVEAQLEAVPEHRSEADLWLYWTAGKGRAKWTTAAKPLLALHAELAKHMPPLKAHTAALSWFEDGLGRKPRVSDGTLPEVRAVTANRPRLHRARQILAQFLPLPPVPGEVRRWNPADHPRDPDGKFGSGIGGAGDDRFVTPAQRIVASAYGALSSNPGDWVSLADLRDQIGASASRDEIDQALHELASRPGVHVERESNQKTLTPRDNAAAVTFGGDDRNLLMIEAPESDLVDGPPLPATTLAPVRPGKAAPPRTDEHAAILEALADPSITEPERVALTALLPAAPVSSEQADILEALADPSITDAERITLTALLSPAQAPVKTVTGRDADILEALADPSITDAERIALTKMLGKS